MKGEKSYPARYINGQAPHLEQLGWIEAWGDGWRITNGGILAWAKMNERMLSHKWAIRAAQFDELRQCLQIVINDVGMCCAKSGCEQPRVKAKSGAAYEYCEAHMRAKWAAYKQSR